MENVNQPQNQNSPSDPNTNPIIPSMAPTKKQAKTMEHIPNTKTAVAFGN